MSPRKNIPESVENEVLVQVRRRCSLCFGLNRDDKPKRGQIAHLDKNPSNNNPSNLAFLCFDHHDEFDSRTSQSKGFKAGEVKKYREELIKHFGVWTNQIKQNELLNFLAYTIDLDVMADAAIKVCSGLDLYGVEHAFEVLTTDSFNHCDYDLLIPHLLALDYFASWGWLTYTDEEKEIQGEMPRVFVTVTRKPICDEVANAILKKLRGDGKNVDQMIKQAKNRGWLK